MTEILEINQPVAQVRAKAVLQAGQCLVFPTDTVYGIAADCRNAQAVQGLLNAKQRGRDMPPPILAADLEDLVEIVDFSAAALALAQKFWPGALTLILPMASGAGLNLGDLTDSVAVRIPDHDSTRKLLKATGPLAVSSANINGLAAALTVSEAVTQLGENVALYLDGGPASGPVPSTIISLLDQPKIIRLGRLSADTLAQVHPELSRLVEQNND